MSSASGCKIPADIKCEPEPPKNPCVICLEEISESSTALPCQHPYDYICLLSWLELRQTCPLCNAAIQHIEVFDKALNKLVQHRVEPPRPKPARLPPQTTNSIALRDYPRRQPQRRWDPPQERISTDIAILRRRHVYRTKMRCLHVGSNRISRFRNFTPRMVRADEELQSRAKMFIRRELQVFEWTNENAEFILEYILAILKTVDLKSSTGAAEDMLTDFLGRGNAGIFCHEIHAFLRSPFVTLEAFDGFVQYKLPLPMTFDGEGLPIVPEGSRKRRREVDPNQGGPVMPESRRRRR